jgi:aminopeptidase N
MRLRGGLCITLLFIILSLSVHARAYDIRHYDLSIEPDFVAKRISLSAAVLIDNTSLENSFSFELNERYQSVDVSSPESPVVVERQRGLVTITVEKPAPKITLVFNLKGSLGKSMDEERDVVDDHSLFLLWSDRFYPITFSDWATVKTIIILPAEFKVVAPGREIKVEHQGPKTMHVFESTVPEVSFSVFADTQWIKTERKLNGIRMQTLLHPDSQRFAEQIFATSSQVLQFYSDTFCPYPFAQFSFITIKGMFARRAFSDSVGYEPKYLEKEFTTTGHDAHETSLLWWGYIIRGTGRGSSQWLEGFGDYAEVLYGEKYGKPLPKIFQFFRSKYLALPAEKDLLYSELRGSTDQAFVHGKYPWLMHLIRYVIGNNGFERAMKLVFKKQKFHALTMDEFVATLEEGSGQSLKWFQDEWLKRRGVPIISLKSDVQDVGGTYQITCVLEQIGEIYHLPVEIGIQTEEGIKLEKVFMKEKQATFSLQSKKKPDRILLDPNDWIIKRVAVASSTEPKGESTTLLPK